MLQKASSWTMPRYYETQRVRNKWQVGISHRSAERLWTRRKYLMRLHNCLSLEDKSALALFGRSFSGPEEYQNIHCNAYSICSDTMGRSWKQQQKRTKSSESFLAGRGCLGEVVQPLTEAHELGVKLCLTMISSSSGQKSHIPWGIIRSPTTSLRPRPIMIQFTITPLYIKR